MHMFSRLASTTSLDDSKYTTVHTHSLVVSQNLYLWRFAFVLNLSVNLSISNTVAFKLWRKKNTNLSHIVGWRIKCLFSVKSKNSTRTISLMCLLVFAFPLYVRWKFSSHIYLCQMLFSFFISFIFQIWISMFFSVSGFCSVEWTHSTKIWHSSFIGAPLNITLECALHNVLPYTFN